MSKTTKKKAPARTAPPPPSKKAKAELIFAIERLWGGCRAAGRGPGSGEHRAYLRALELIAE